MSTKTWSVELRLGRTSLERAIVSAPNRAAAIAAAKIECPGILGRIVARPIRVPTMPAGPRWIPDAQTSAVYVLTGMRPDDLGPLRGTTASLEVWDLDGDVPLPLCALSLGRVEPMGLPGGDAPGLWGVDSRWSVDDRLNFSVPVHVNGFGSIGCHRAIALPGLARWLDEHASELDRGETDGRD